MSRWTYVTGAICVDTYSEQAVKAVEDFLKSAPKITGSERNVEFFLNQPSGYNSSETNWGEEIGEEIRKEWETSVILTLHGTLRDRLKEQTEKELQDFLQSIRERFEIDFQSVNVIDDTDLIAFSKSELNHMNK